MKDEIVIQVLILAKLIQAEKIRKGSLLPPDCIKEAVEEIKKNKTKILELLSKDQ